MPAALFVLVDLLAVDREAVDVVADEAEHGGNEREGGDDDDEDRRRSGEGDAVHELEAHDEHAEHRDHDGDAGEHDGLARRADGPDRGVVR